MSGQGNSAQSLSPHVSLAPESDQKFKRGRALFQRLHENEVEEYNRFRKLSKT